MLLLACMAFAFPYNAPAHNCEREYYEPLCDNGNPTDGYFWHGTEVWVPGYITVETWFTPSPDHFTGKAVYYAQGLMEATAEWRGMSLDGFVGGVALMSPSDVGETVYIKFREWEGPFLVVDCARRGDMWPVIMHRGEAVEVGHRTAIRWELEPPYPDVIVSKKPPNGLQSEPVKLTNWYENVYKFTDHIGPRVLYRAPNQWRIEGEWQTFNGYGLHQHRNRARLHRRR